ncbi:isopentenyl-diphosphate Delta-isomerase [Draconibacterium sediminis]|uniref:Isopentenyl-diphosphate delta-isomerase n=1 Tax=Draconibacterium sediminis TaxID=1544798 RepID=A0A0D8J709_9BACT|nr:isopentenyl-diphosphate Delta-isomerase [Draconibacterium sediminis]KJF42687.1 isopentenyl-diphosphate delta-isomerase [Draconibacterium sediminis]
MTNNNKIEKVILVDENDKVLGEMEKMEAHLKGLLHRAISVFIVNSKGEWLIHQRAFNKYHSNGLWTNTCCSHPYPEETSVDAANRRLMQEMGMKAPLQEIFAFIYKEELDNQLTEHELDRVFIGFSDDKPEPNADEVSNWKYINFEELKTDVKNNPENYTVWFKKIYERVEEHLKVKT